MTSSVAFERLVDAGCDEHQLGCLLSLTAALPDDLPKPKLKKLATEAASLADQIDSVLHDSLDAVMGQLDGDPSWTTYWKLPGTLRAFATQLKTLAAQPHRSHAARDLQWAAVSAYVTFATGTAHDVLVAALVSPTGIEFGAEDLKTFRARHKSLLARIQEHFELGRVTPST